jgi:acetylornithine aminotransferase
MHKSTPTIELTDRYTTANYARFPVAFVRGQGCRLWDEDGKEYLDMFSGLGVACLGYGHKGLSDAVAAQTALLMHTSNLFYNQASALLAQTLVERSFADRVFFCNSGTEANEAAIKMARRAGGERYEVVSAIGSFHGRTLGSLAATGQGDLREGYGPMPEGFIHVAYNDAAAMAEAVGARTAAVMVEPVLGEGGVVVPSAGYLGALRDICDSCGALLILDEVQTGVGRSGTLYAYQTSGITPDILTTAKGLAGGLPIGAVLATETAAAAFVAGTHGSTFGANPVVCRAALAVLAAFDDEGVLENCRRSGEYLRCRLEEFASKRDDIVEVRGSGLMLGMELRRPARPLVEAALAHGLVINATAATVLRFLPPLIISCEEIDEGMAKLAHAMT